MNIKIDKLIEKNINITFFSYLFKSFNKKFKSHYQKHFLSHSNVLSVIRVAVGFKMYVNK